MRKQLPWIFALVMVLVGAQPNLARSSDLTQLVFASGPAGGAWYGLAGSVNTLIKTEFPKLLVNVMPGGGVGNVTLVEKGRAQLGMTVAHLYHTALQGTEPYTEVHKNIRAVAEVGTSDMGIFLITKKTPVNSIREIKDKKYPLRLTTSPKGSTPALATARFLELYGITFDDLKKWGGSVTFTSYTDAAQLIADGHADAFITAPGPAVTELTASVAMKALPLDEKVVDEMVRKYGYAKNFIPKGKHPYFAEECWIIGEPNVIIAHIEIPDEIVYGVTKLICNNPRSIKDWGAHHAEFNPKAAWKNVGGPLHAGAAKFYREAGYMK
jgi:TRAP transporter TAXI family solute receptor